MAEQATVLATASAAAAAAVERNEKTTTTTKKGVGRRGNKTTDERPTTVEKSAAAGAESETTDAEKQPTPAAAADGKKVRKRKSKLDTAAANTSSKSQNSELDDADSQPTTPKVFFHTKRRKTPNSSSANESINQRYSNLINTTPKKATTPTSNKQHNVSGSATPNKKFKLHKAKSSSSENLNNSSSSSSSSEDDDDNNNNHDDDNDVNTDDQTTLDKLKRKKTVTIVEQPKLAVDHSKQAEETPHESSLSSSSKSHKQSPTRGGKKGAVAAALSVSTASTSNSETSILTGKEKPASTKTKSPRLSLQTSSSSLPVRNSSRNNKGANATPLIMTTGITLTDKEKQIISNLGGKLVTDIKECTHLLATKMIKSCKFLSCINKSAHILNLTWLQESNRAKMFLNPSTYSLVDTQFEKHHKFSLHTSLGKAKTSPLFEGWKFLLKCEKIPNEDLVKADIKCIIECGGGEIIDELPSNADELAKCCIVFDDYDQYQNDHEKKSKTESTLNVTVDVLLSSVIKQSFDANYQIESSST